jgi:hypothetical protein
MEFDRVVRIFQEEFNGAHPNDIFAEFDPTPLASASIAQVHRAALADGTLVAVKYVISIFLVKNVCIFVYYSPSSCSTLHHLSLFDKTNY